jgi:hypothetical protein
MDYYRGGSNLVPRRNEVRIHRISGLVLPQRGVSVYSRPDGLDRFGGAYRIVSVPAGLRIVQIGVDPFHHEIIPDQPLRLDEYEKLLRQIILARV